MWKRMLLGMITELVQMEITRYVWNIQPAERQNEAIEFLTRMKSWMSSSSSSTTRAVGAVLPFVNN